jgi:hypothetical protein
MPHGELIEPRGAQAESPQVVADQRFTIGHAYSRLSDSHTLFRETTKVVEKIGRGEWIRTTDLLVPNQAL